jgi:hypothetical protein
MKATRGLTSTYVNELDSNGTLTAQSLSKAHRKPLRGVACGVLVAIGIGLSSMPLAGGSENNQTYTPKQYAYYSLDNLKEYICLTKLYGKESAWNHNAYNSSSGATGIPQGKSIYLLTATPYQQIDWGIEYNLNRYGSMCSAWAHWLRYGWH